MSLINNYIRKGLVSAMLAFAVTFPTSAIDLPVTTVNGKNYYYYDVQPQETLFSLSQRLGISREEIVSYNPGVDGGLKAYTRLYFPVESGPSTIAEGSHISSTHEVKKGETLYGISKKYGISIDRIIALNPSARDGIKSGDMLIISHGTETETPATVIARQSGTHTIAAGETLYRIAVNNGITVEQLLAANPGIDASNYSEGTVINIPGNDVSTHVVERPFEASVSEVDVDLQPVRSTPQPVEVADNHRQTEPKTNDNLLETATGNNVTPIVSENAADENSVLNIAVMLPFNLDEEKPSKEAENFTEFYRGFLLATQNLSQSGRPVNIQVYDTKGNLDVLKGIMDSVEMEQVNIFVAPPSTPELDYIISKADDDRQFVFNAFAVRNASYKDNPNVIQANIPHTMLYQRAIDAFMDEMAGRTPVFIQRIGATADKEEFTTMLKSQLSDKGITFSEITYENSLKDEDLANLDTNGSYVIVPLSSSATEFNKIAPGLRRFKDTLSATDGIAMFGYPEWLTFRGDRKENLGALNASIYSRFYYDESYYPARRVVDQYRQAYGRNMNNAVPSQALMGYDVASFIIKSLRRNNGDFHIGIAPYEGLQTDFIFSDSDCDGLVNTSVELIKFRDGGFTEHKNI